MKQKFFWNSRFFYDPTDVGNLISGSSAFSKPSLYIWKFLVRVLLKPSLKDFVHCLASMWSMCNCLVVWAFFSIALLWDWNKTDLFQACGHCRIFQICWSNSSLFWHWRKTACVNYMKTTQHLLMGFQGQFWLCQFLLYKLTLKSNPSLDMPSLYSF